MKNYRENSSIRVLGNIVLLVLIGGSAIAQMIYTIPWATTQPKFVFPLYFENAQGNKDTLYLGYDPLATGYGVLDYDSDGVFGVKKSFVDTNGFYVCWGSDLRINGPQSRLKDSIYKANVSPLVDFKIPIMYEIGINGGTLPLKVSWDVSALRSDSLPFLHSPSGPKAQGKILFYYSGDEYMSENGQQLFCMNDQAIISDSILIAICSSRDSVTINNINQLPIPTFWGFLNFYLQDWTGIAVGIGQLNKRENIDIYPNPFTDRLNLTIKYSCRDCKVEIFNTLGERVFSQFVFNSQNLKLDLAFLIPGVYFLNFHCQDYKSSFLIFKL